MRLMSTGKPETGNSVHFSSVQDGIYALEKARMRGSTPSLRRFSQRCLCGNGSNVRLSDDGPLSSFQLATRRQQASS